MDPHLHEAARLGSVPLLNAITTNSDQQILYSATPQILNNALHIAARLGHADFTKEILGRCGAHLMQANSLGDTPLHCAARTGQLEVVEILLNWIVMEEKNVELRRMTNKEKNTALHEALRNRHENVAVKLLESDLGLAYLVNETGESPLHMAAREELLQVVEKILDFEPSDEKTNMVRRRDAHGRTALHYAACQDNSTIVEKLLSFHRSLAYILDNDGYSSLHVAAASGSTLAIAELLKHCPDASEQLDPSGKNVFHIAIMYNKNPTVRSLLRMEVLEGMINEPDTDGNTLLHLAIKEFSFRVLLLLSRDGRVDETIVNKDGHTALDLMELDLWFEDVLALILKCPRYHGVVSRGRRRKIPSQICQTKPEGMTATLYGEYRDRVSTYTLVAALIATVTFTAAFTMPGGYKSDGPNQGAAVLMKRGSFKAFLLSNTIALYCSLFVVVCFIWAQDYRERYVLYWGHRLTIAACLALMVSFMAAVYAVVAPDCMWLAIVVLAFGFSTPFFLYLLIGRSIWLIP